MTRILLALLLLAATPAFAEEAKREIFPSDYTPSACAPSKPCESFTKVSFEQAAAKFLLRDLESKWNEAHRDELTAMTEPYCRKRATCIASPGREWWFCNDVFAQELRAACAAKFDEKTKTHDYAQCRAWVDVFSIGVDQHGKADWETAQKCAKDSATSTSLRRMEWWSVPAVIPVDYKGFIQVFAIDAQTHVPVQADIGFGDQKVYASDPPTGTPVTYYAFKWPRKLVRVRNAQGHTDVIAATMTLTAPGYETIAVPVPTVVPMMNVKVMQDAKRLTVIATDSHTGKPVEAQVYAGGNTIGFTNQPIAFKLGRKHPEIWVRSPFDAYSDVVAIAATK